MFKDVVQEELKRLDAIGSAKRHEKIIAGFDRSLGSAKAIIDGKKYALFNSNDYFGLRLDPNLRAAEESATKEFGTGPGAVRFISGTLGIHKELEQKIASFHGREDAIVFSSSFAANVALLHCLLAGQSKDSLVDSNVVVFSDALNHRSIIDGIRIANLPKEQRRVFKHLDSEDLARQLEEVAGKFARVVIVTDGIFSMLGEHQDLQALNAVVAKYQDKFEQGVLTIVDDAHGVGAFGETGRGTEEHCDSRCDFLVATLGKAFGTDGGYIVGDKAFIDYLRESAATYIYSNNISPGTAGAAIAAIETITKGEVLATLRENISYFQKQAKSAGIEFAAKSAHPIQPVLIGDTLEAKRVSQELFANGFLTTPITYPVVPKGRDEIRVQISATHTKEEIDACIKAFVQALKK